MRSTSRYSQTPKNLFYEHFRYCESENLDEKSRYVQKFSIQGTFNIQLGSPMNFFGSTRQFFFKKKRDTPIWPNFLLSESLKHQEGHLTFFFGGEKVDVFLRYPLLWFTNFSLPTRTQRQRLPGIFRNFQKYQKGSLTEFS